MDELTHRLTITLTADVWQAILNDPAFFPRIKPATRAAILIEEAVRAREEARKEGKK